MILWFKKRENCHFILLIKKRKYQKKSLIFLCRYAKNRYICTNQKESHISRLIEVKTFLSLNRRKVA